MCSRHGPSHDVPLRLDFWLRVARTTSGFLSMAIDVLPTEEYDTIVDAYGLAEVGFAKRRFDSPNPAPGEEEEEVTLLTARRHLNQGLEMMLEAALRDLPDDRGELKLVLEIIRGRSFDELFGVADTLFPMEG